MDLLVNKWAFDFVCLKNKQNFYLNEIGNLILFKIITLYQRINVPIFRLARALLSKVKYATSDALGARNEM